MSGKNQYPLIFNWQSTDPSIGFLPLNGNTSDKGSVPSGVATGAMASTNVIYSQIVDVSKMDNIGLHVSWTGTAVGVFKVTASNPGTQFSALTFSPLLQQPNGSDGFYTISLNQFPYKYILLQYTNTSGTGVLSVVGQQKDLN